MDRLNASLWLQFCKTLHDAAGESRISLKSISEVVRITSQSHTGNHKKPDTLAQLQSAALESAQLAVSPAWAPLIVRHSRPVLSELLLSAYQIHFCEHDSGAAGSRSPPSQAAQAGPSRSVAFLGIGRLAQVPNASRRGLIEVLNVDADACSRGVGAIDLAIESATPGSCGKAEDLLLMARQVAWGAVLWMEAAGAAAQAEAQYVPEPNDLLCGAFSAQAAAVVPVWIARQPMSKLHDFLMQTADPFCQSCALAALEMVASNCRVVARDAVKSNWQFRAASVPWSPPESASVGPVQSRKRSRNGDIQDVAVDSAGDSSHNTEAAAASSSSDAAAGPATGGAAGGNAPSFSVNSSSSSSSAAASGPQSQIDPTYTQVQQEAVGSHGPMMGCLQQDPCFRVLPPQLAGVDPGQLHPSWQGTGTREAALEVLRKQRIESLNCQAAEAAAIIASSAQSTNGLDLAECLLDPDAVWQHQHELSQGSHFTGLGESSVEHADQDNASFFEALDMLAGVPLWGESSFDSAALDRTTESDSHPVVLNDSTLALLRSIVSQSESGVSVLLYGPSGSGKTSSIESLARLRHQLHLQWTRSARLPFVPKAIPPQPPSPVSVVSLHLDDTASGKDLFGQYSVSDTPGEFEWKAGTVLEAARSGSWIVFEGADQLSADLVSAIMPLLDGKSVQVPGKEQTAMQLQQGYRSDHKSACSAVASSSIALLSDQEERETLVARANRRFRMFFTATLSIQADSGAPTELEDGTSNVPLPLESTGSLSRVWAPQNVIGDKSNIEPISSSGLAAQLAAEHDSVADFRFGLAGSVGSLPRLVGCQHLLCAVESQPPQTTELVSLIRGCFPVLHERTVRGIVSSHMSLVRLAEVQSAGVTRQIATERLAALASTAAGASPDAGDRMSQVSIEALRQRLTVNDTLRWARRVACMFSDGEDSVVRQDSLSTDARLSIAKHGMDMYGARISDKHDAGLVLETISPEWGLHAAELVDSYYSAPHIDSHLDSVRIGRASLPVARTSGVRSAAAMEASSGLPDSFAPTVSGCRTLEQVACAVQDREPMLLVGETGNGKTAAVQALAEMVNAKLVVVNMSAQTDIGDLLGGYRPAPARRVALDLYRELVGELFPSVFKSDSNSKFLSSLADALDRKNYPRLAAGMARALALATSKIDRGHTVSPHVRIQWDRWATELRRFQRMLDILKKDSKSLESAGAAFRFELGPLTKAIMNGHWILLDEINLAPHEALQRLLGLLESEDGSVILSERGDSQPISRHPGFQLIGAMNPATDIGKKDLPPGIRQRFTEVWVSDVDDEDDLKSIVLGILRPCEAIDDSDLAACIDGIVSFHVKSRVLAFSGALVDSAGAAPQYSLRTLVRACKSFCSLLNSGLSAKGALFEGLCAAYATQIQPAIDTANLGKSKKRKSKGSKKTARGSPGTAVQSIDFLRELRSSGTDSAGYAQLVLACHSAVSNLPGDMSVPEVRASGVLIDCFDIATGDSEPLDWAAGFSADDAAGQRRYVMTASVQFNLRNLARAVACSKSPVLLQGPTSSGKTSLVEYLAARTGNMCYRVNNHQNTDISEYFGSFQPTGAGSLEFKEGVLVAAARQGAWLVLDELNLAPTEVLEALNRLLDDNRELYIPETQEVVRASPRFRLFATQNPAGGTYGGRKPLSRAFRNRFFELRVDEAPESELKEIIVKSSHIAPPFAEAMVRVAAELRRARQASDVFAGSTSFVTTRDLLRWAARVPSTWQELGCSGYMLLAERLRVKDEQNVLMDVLQRTCKCSLCPSDLYGDPALYAHGDKAASAPAQASPSTTSNSRVADTMDSKELPDLTWTQQLRRVVALLVKCMFYKEPVLLVGETGTGKTSAVQFVAKLRNQALRIVNCHQTMDATDFIGSMRPLRAQRRRQLKYDAATAVFAYLSRTSDDSPPELDHLAQMAYDDMLRLIDNDDRDRSGDKRERPDKQLEEHQAAKVRRTATGRSEAAASEPQSEVDPSVERTRDIVVSCRDSARQLFEWADGPLVESMLDGSMFLLDEVSLAEDAVLERLNSVLEPERKLTVPERCSADEPSSGAGDSNLDSIHVKAKEGFRFIATMNPGDDFGKRELSPALRSRFTEIWVPQIDSAEDIDAVVSQIFVQASLAQQLQLPPDLLTSMVGGLRQLFIQYTSQACSDDGDSLQSMVDVQHVPFTLRDVRQWAEYIIEFCAQQRAAGSPSSTLDARAWEGFGHAAALVLLDGFGLGTSVDAQAGTDSGVHTLCKFIARLGGSAREDTLSRSIAAFDGEVDGELSGSSHGIRLGSFLLQYGSVEPKPVGEIPFAFDAPTVRANVGRVLRALQSTQPVLLEGSPGVGKSSLVQALAAVSGNPLVRINLSDQTDIADLIGADLPVASDSAGESADRSFVWRDGVLLAALKRGDWVLLDELNLAPQPVLEGLNAILDHRASVFIPELGQTVHCPSTFRVFATQNPVSQGGGRKQLPKSFLNRFSKVYLRELAAEDSIAILRHSFSPDQATPGASPHLPLWNEDTLARLVRFVSSLASMSHRSSVDYFGPGTPFEFNLRDIGRLRTAMQTLLQLWPCQPLQRVNSVSQQQQFAFQLAVLMCFAGRFRSRTGRNTVAIEFARCFNQSLPNEFIVKMSEMLNNFAAGDGGTTKNLGFVCLSCMVGIRARLPLLVYGTGGSRRLSALRQAASLAGHKTDYLVLQLSSSTDAADLVGSFEQVAVNPIAASQKLILRLAHEVAVVASQLCSSCGASARVRLSTSICKLLQMSEQAVSDSRSDVKPVDTFASLRVCAESCAALAMNHADPDHYRVLQGLLSQLRQKQSSNERVDLGRFVWVDGPLTRAVRDGLMLVIRGANVAPPAVLDRLNALLEPDGVLSIPECGTSADGVARVVPTHPMFRIAFLVDIHVDSRECVGPELSRAMRNRCLEIAMPVETVDADNDESSLQVSVQTERVDLPAHFPRWSQVLQDEPSALPSLLTGRLALPASRRLEMHTEPLGSCSWLGVSSFRRAIEACAVTHAGNGSIAAKTVVGSDRATQAPVLIDELPASVRSMSFDTIGAILLGLQSSDSIQILLQGDGVGVSSRAVEFVDTIMRLESPVLRDSLWRQEYSNLETVATGRFRSIGLQLRPHAAVEAIGCAYLLPQSVAFLAEAVISSAASGSMQAILGHRLMSTASLTLRAFLTALAPSGSQLGAVRLHVSLCDAAASIRNLVDALSSADMPPDVASSCLASIACLQCLAQVTGTGNSELLRATSDAIESVDKLVGSRLAHVSLTLAPHEDPVAVGQPLPIIRSLSTDICKKYLSLVHMGFSIPAMTVDDAPMFHKLVSGISASGLDYEATEAIAYVIGSSAFRKIDETEREVEVRQRLGALTDGALQSYSAGVDGILTRLSPQDILPAEDAWKLVNGAEADTSTSVASRMQRPKFVLDSKTGDSKAQEGVVFLKWIRSDLHGENDDAEPADEAKVHVEFSPTSAGRAGKQVFGLVSGQQSSRVGAYARLLSSLKWLERHASSARDEIRLGQEAAVAVLSRVVGSAHSIQSTELAPAWRVAAALCMLATWRATSKPELGTSTELLQLIRPARVLLNYLRRQEERHAVHHEPSADNLEARVILDQAYAAVPVASRRDCLSGMQASEASQIILGAENAGSVSRTIGDLDAYVSRSAATLAGLASLVPSAVTVPSLTKHAGLRLSRQLRALAQQVPERDFLRRTANTSEECPPSRMIRLAQEVREEFHSPSRTSLLAEILLLLTERIQTSSSETCTILDLLASTVACEIQIDKACRLSIVDAQLLGGMRREQAADAMHRLKRVVFDRAAQQAKAGEWCSDGAIAVPLVGINLKKAESVPAVLAEQAILAASSSNGFPSSLAHAPTVRFSGSHRCEVLDRVENNDEIIFESRGIAAAAAAAQQEDPIAFSSQQYDSLREQAQFARTLLSSDAALASLAEVLRSRSPIEQVEFDTSIESSSLLVQCVQGAFQRRRGTDQLLRSTLASVDAVLSVLAPSALLGFSDVAVPLMDALQTAGRLIVSVISLAGPQKATGGSPGASGRLLSALKEYQREISDAQAKSRPSSKAVRCHLREWCASLRHLSSVAGTAALVSSGEDFAAMIQEVFATCSDISTAVDDIRRRRDEPAPSFKMGISVFSSEVDQVEEDQLRDYAIGDRHLHAEIQETQEDLFDDPSESAPEPGKSGLVSGSRDMPEPYLFDDPEDIFQLLRLQWECFGFGRTGGSSSFSLLHAGRIPAVSRQQATQNALASLCADECLAATYDGAAGTVAEPTAEICDSAVFAVARRVASLSTQARAHSRIERRTGVVLSEPGIDASIEASLDRLIGRGAINSGSTASSDKLDPAIPEPSGNGFDFYRSPCISEMSIFLSACDSLHMRVLQLLRVFPGQDVLSEILRVVKSTKEIPLFSPIASALGAGERLVAASQRYEKYAAEKAALGKALLMVQAVCARWRRLELGSWSSVLLSIQRRFELRARALALMFHRAAGLASIEDQYSDGDGNASSRPQQQSIYADAAGISEADKWLFTAQKPDVGFANAAAVVRSPSSGAGGEDPSPSLVADVSVSSAGATLEGVSRQGAAIRVAFEASERFLRSSPVGEFGTRMQIVLSNAKSLIVLAQSSPSRRICVERIGRTMLQLVAYFWSHMPAVAEHAKTMRYQVEQELNDAIRLHRWQSQTYESAQQSSRAGHSKLIHTAKKWNECLSVPVSTILEAQSLRFGSSGGSKHIGELGTVGILCHFVGGAAARLPSNPLAGAPVIQSFSPIPFAASVPAALPAGLLDPSSQDHQQVCKMLGALSKLPRRLEDMLRRNTPVARSEADDWRDFVRQWQAFVEFVQKPPDQATASDAVGEVSKEKSTTPQKYTLFHMLLKRTKSIGWENGSASKLVRKLHGSAMVGAAALFGSSIPPVSIGTHSVEGGTVGADLESQHWRDYDLAVRVRVMLAQTQHSSFGGSSTTQADGVVLGEGDLSPSQIEALGTAAESQLVYRTQSRAMIAGLSAHLYAIDVLVRRIQDVEPAAGLHPNVAVERLRLAGVLLAKIQQRILRTRSVIASVQAAAKPAMTTCQEALKTVAELAPELSGSKLPSSDRDLAWFATSRAVSCNESLSDCLRSLNKAAEHLSGHADTSNLILGVCCKTVAARATPVVTTQAEWLNTETEVVVAVQESIRELDRLSADLGVDLTDASDRQMQILASPSPLAASVLDTTRSDVQAVCDELTEILSLDSELLGSSALSHGAKLDKGLAETFQDFVKQCMLSAQRVRKLADLQADAGCFALQKYWLHSLAALRIGPIRLALSRLAGSALEVLASAPDASSTSAARQAIDAGLIMVKPVVRHLESIMQAITEDHVASSAAGHVSLCSIIFLLRRGLCRPQAERDSKSGEEAGQEAQAGSGQGEAEEGTGLGTGTGEEDISEQLAKEGADMGQIEGLKDDETVDAGPQPGSDQNDDDKQQALDGEGDVAGGADVQQEGEPPKPEDETGIEVGGMGEDGAAQEIEQASDGEASDDEPETTDLDEEMGDGGELDEAIDVSLWEGEKDGADDEQADAGSVQGEDGADEAEGDAGEAADDGPTTNANDELGASADDDADGNAEREDSNDQPDMQNEDGISGEEDGKASDSEADENDEIPGAQDEEPEQLGLKNGSNQEEDQAQAEMDLCEDDEPEETAAGDAADAEPDKDGDVADGAAPEPTADDAAGSDADDDGGSSEMDNEEDAAASSVSEDVDHEDNSTEQPAGQDAGEAAEGQEAGGSGTDGQAPMESGDEPPDLQSADAGVGDSIEGEDLPDDDDDNDAPASGSGQQDEGTSGGAASSAVLQSRGIGQEDDGDGENDGPTEQSLQDMIDAASRFQDAMNPFESGFDDAIDHALSNAMQDEPAVESGDQVNGSEMRAAEMAPDATGSSAALGLDMSEQQADTDARSRRKQQDMVDEDGESFDDAAAKTTGETDAAAEAVGADVQQTAMVDEDSPEDGFEAQESKTAIDLLEPPASHEADESSSEAELGESRDGSGEASKSPDTQARPIVEPSVRVGLVQRQEDGADLAVDMDDGGDVVVAIAANLGDERRCSEMWSRAVAETSTRAQQLCEKLRLILSPTKASRLAGDYRTGKRINMRRVIQYIASQFRKDKIWLRRTKASQRTYQVLLAIDDSKSMQAGSTAKFAVDSIAMISQALNKLEVGQVGVVSFGKDSRVVHDLSKPFTRAGGGQLLRELTFAQTQTDPAKMLRVSLAEFEKQANAFGAASAASSGLGVSCTQLLFVISDGMLEQSKRNEVTQQLMRAKQLGVLVIMIVLDAQQPSSSAAGAASGGASDPDTSGGLTLDEAKAKAQLAPAASQFKTSILETESISMVQGKWVRRPYLDGYPFPFYVVVQDHGKLPQVLADTVQQWVRLVNESNSF